MDFARSLRAVIFHPSAAARYFLYNTFAWDLPHIVMASCATLGTPAVSTIAIANGALLATHFAWIVGISTAPAIDGSAIGQGLWMIALVICDLSFFVVLGLNSYFDAHGITQNLMWISTIFFSLVLRLLSEAAIENALYGAHWPRWLMPQPQGRYGRISWFPLPPEPAPLHAVDIRPRP